MDRLDCDDDGKKAREEENLVDHSLRGEFRQHHGLWLGSGPSSIWCGIVCRRVTCGEKAGSQADRAYYIGP